MYYIYHIPGKKIGVTCDLNNRVTKQQGYEASEYEVLEQSEDIDWISRMEIELQKSYGYKVDRKLYKNLKPQTNMKINVTEQTTTFPVPVNKLKGGLKLRAVLRNTKLPVSSAFQAFTIDTSANKPVSKI